MLHLLSGPRRFSKKLQAGFNGRIVLETVDSDSMGKTIPAVVFNKLHDDIFKGDSMHGILGLLGIHPRVRNCVKRPSFDMNGATPPT